MHEIPDITCDTVIQIITVNMQYINILIHINTVYYSIYIIYTYIIYMLYIHTERMASIQGPFWGKLVILPAAPSGLGAVYPVEFVP